MGTGQANNRAHGWMPAPERGQDQVLGKQSCPKSPAGGHRLNRSGSSPSAKQVLWAPLSLPWSEEAALGLVTRLQSSSDSTSWGGIVQGRMGLQGC